MDAEQRFIEGLLELQYGLDAVDDLKKIAPQGSWASDWPEDKRSFWNAEAFLWSRKIPKEKREMITKELSFLSHGKNLDLGSGAYSYIPSTCFDISPKMLQFNDNCKEKITGDLEKGLPFSNASFDSVTAVFVINYVQNYSSLCREIRRVLKKEGTFVMILSANPVNDWQRQKEVVSLPFLKWVKLLEETGFKVDHYLKEELHFFKCRIS